jgi:hypothetical protein
MWEISYSADDEGSPVLTVPVNKPEVSVAAAVASTFETRNVSPTWWYWNRFGLFASVSLK